MLSWINGVRRFAIGVVVVAILGAIWAAHYTATNVSVDTSTTEMLSPEVPFRRIYSEFRQAFPSIGELIVIVIDAPTPDQAEDAAVALATRLSKDADHFYRVESFEQNPFFRSHGLLYLDIDELQAMSDRIVDSQALLTTLGEDPTLRGLAEVLSLAVREIGNTAAEPEEFLLALDRIAEVVDAQRIGEDRLLSWQAVLEGDNVAEKGSRAFIQAYTRPDFTGFAPAASGMRAIRAAERELGLQENGVHVRLTGEAALATEEMESVFTGARMAATISIVLVTLLLLIGLRSIRLVVATVSTLLVGLTLTAAFATVIVGSLNLISVAFAVLFIGLAVDFSIHFVLRYKEEIDRGELHRNALPHAALGVGGALLLCAVSAALAFFSFLPTDYHGLAELGFISGFGMFIALILNLSLMPAMLTLMPARPSVAAARRPVWLSQTTSRLVDRHGGMISLFALALGVVAALPALQARFDFNPLNLHDPTTESVQTARELLSDPETNPESISAAVATRDEAARLMQRLEELDVVSHMVWIESFVPDNQPEKLAIIHDVALTLTPLLVPGPERSPPSVAEDLAALSELIIELEAAAVNEGLTAGTRAAAARLAESLERYLRDRGVGDASIVALERALLANLPGRLNRLRDSMEAGKVEVDTIPESLHDQYLNEDGIYRIEIFPREDISDNRALRRFVGAVREIAPRAIGEPVIILDAGSAVTGAFFQALAIAVVGISLLLLVVLRSVRDSVLVLAPLTLAAVLTVATTVVFGIPFNFANLIALPLLMGLGVASGIHLVLRARGAVDSIDLLHTSTPRAVIFSALTTIFSFGTLAVSPHWGTASMGILLTIAISYTLLCTLVVLPALMSWLQRGRKARPTA